LLWILLLIVFFAFIGAGFFVRWLFYFAIAVAIIAVIALVVSRMRRSR
jgi:hypothetical protein